MNDFNPSVPAIAGDDTALGIDGDVQGKVELPRHSPCLAIGFDVFPRTGEDLDPVLGGVHHVDSKVSILRQQGDALNAGESSLE